MTDDVPREDDLEYTTSEGGPVQRQVGVDTDRGQVTRFGVQLEYLVDVDAEEEFATVVRYDHDAEGGAAPTHDVAEDGLHIDIYRDGEKIASHELPPPLPANEALEVAEEHLDANVAGSIRRFEKWHEIDQ